MFGTGKHNESQSDSYIDPLVSLAQFSELQHNQSLNGRSSKLILPDCDSNAHSLGCSHSPDPAQPNRRRFLSAATLAASFALFGRSSKAAVVRANDDCSFGISDKQYRVLVAFIRAQLCVLWGGPPNESAEAVACDVLEYTKYVNLGLQKGFGYVLTWLNLYSLRIYKRPFHRLSPPEVWALLNQGEYQGCQSGRRRKQPPLITYDCNYIEHQAISTLATLVRLVTCSRKSARLFVGMTWSPECRKPANLNSVPSPPRPCLNQHYDVCVIGSGAGGATVAYRAAQQGKRVLIIEAGKWFSPEDLIQTKVNEQGQTELLPARGDEVLMHLYKDGGVQIAREQSTENESLKALDFISPRRRKKIKPRQTINVLQAKVAGGGPNVNNAIHLETKRHVWDSWEHRQPTGVDYDLFFNRMQQIKQDLGVNSAISSKNASHRSELFRRGCELSGNAVDPTPVSIRPDCKGCGSDNSMDPFGSHVGGVHEYQPGKPNSYLMRALNAAVPAEIACELSAVRFDISRDCGSLGGHRVNQLVVEDRRGLENGQAGPQFTINADQFVLSAGPVASTRLLRESYRCAAISNCHLGSRLSGNVGTPVYAVFKKPLINGTPTRPEPGIAQCYIAHEELDWSTGKYRLTKPALENWFHYPGTIAVALTGWFHEYAKVMGCYNHLSTAGMFVPTKVRSENRVPSDGKIKFSLDEAERELLIRGMERIGEIYLAAATPDNPVELFLPTKGVLLDDCGRPFRIRNREQLTWAINEVRRRGPAYVNLLSSHPQGGNPLGSVVDQSSFRAMDDCGRTVDNLYVADASILPAGCEVNPQLTVKALASFAADQMLAAA